MPASKTTKAIIAHVPVIHRGYLQFFKAHPDHTTLFIAGPDIVSKLDYARKDLRALKPAETAKIIKAMNLFDEAKVLSSADLPKLNSKTYDFVLPEDDLSNYLVTHLTEAKTSLFPVFLRWDRRNIEGVNQPDDFVKVSQSAVSKKFMKQAIAASSRSSDIWRRVGAVLQTKDGLNLVATNRGEPTPHSPWIEGDPRNVFNRGVAIELSVFTHAEAALIAESARRGLNLTGAKIYVTTFPCPACAKLIAHSGIKECYFTEGYAILDGKRVMEDYGVKVYRVDIGDTDATHPAAWVPYKKS